MTSAALINPLYRGSTFSVAAPINPSTGRPYGTGFARVAAPGEPLAPATWSDTGVSRPAPAILGGFPVNPVGAPPVNPIAQSENKGMEWQRKAKETSASATKADPYLRVSPGTDLKGAADWQAGVNADRAQEKMDVTDRAATRFAAREAAANTRDPANRNYWQTQERVVPGERNISGYGTPAQPQLNLGAIQSPAFNMPGTDIKSDVGTGKPIEFVGPGSGKNTWTHYF